jgi:lipopolysaccharide transport system permease protein
MVCFVFRGVEFRSRDEEVTPFSAKESIVFMSTVSPSLEPEEIAIPSTGVHTHIEPSKAWIALDLNSIWAYRELLYFLVWRDVKVRYKQTLLGALWAILQPFLTMVVFSIFFGRLAGVPSDGLPYPVFTYAALLPWQLFSYALNESGNSLVANQRLITKIYFPRLVIPISAVLAGLVDFAIAFIVLIGLMAYYDIYPTLAILALPFFILLAVATALAVGLWLSALMVEYRDVRYVIPFLTQFWFFLTPIAYPSSLVPEWLRPLYALNPMVGVVEGFRWALLGTDIQIGVLTLVSLLVAALLLIGGLIYFRRMERTFADVI